MSFYSTLVAHRRLAGVLIATAIIHLVMIVAAAAAIIWYQQFWAIAAVLWLPLMTLALRWATGFLQGFFQARRTDVLAVNGVQVAAHEDTGIHERLSNVVEEIAVAAGERQPDVAVCQSDSLNAFIAYIETGAGRKNLAVIFTSAMAAGFNRHELQAVVAHLFAHRKNFDRMFVAMAGAIYLAIFAAADLFLIANVLNWNYGGSGYFATGPLVVILAMGILYGPVIAALTAHAYVMRRSRFLDDLSALQITHDPESMITALQKLSEAAPKMRAAYDMSNAHFYFDAVTDPGRRFPWQKLLTHPRPQARLKALREAVHGRF